MKTTFPSAKTLRGIVETMNSLAIRDITLKFDDNGIAMRAIDPSRCVFIDMNLPVSFFEDGYEKPEPDDSLDLTLDMESFLAIVRRGSVNDKLILDYDKEKAGKITIKLIGEKKSRRIYTVGLIDPTGERDQIKNLVDNLKKIEYPVVFSPNNEIFIEAIRDADALPEIREGGGVEISVEEDAVILRVTAENGDVEIFLERDTEAINSMEISGEIGVTSFPLSYLKDILKMGTVAEKTEIFLMNKAPMNLRYSLNGEASINIFLAPYVEEEEDDEEDEEIGKEDDE